MTWESPSPCPGALHPEFDVPSPVPYYMDMPLPFSYHQTKGRDTVMSKVVRFEVPKEVKDKKFEQEYLTAAQEVVKEQTILRLFEEGRVSTGYAAKILGLPRYQFVDLLAKSTRSIWEEVAEISGGVPDEAWQAVPADGSEQHDHYLYGAPKKES